MNIAYDLFSRSARDTAIDALHAATALYTQDPIVVQLLDKIKWPAGEGALLDSSCGDGAFLGRALERLLLAHPKISDSDICRRIEGWEIHFSAACQARSRLRSLLIRHGRDASSASSIADRVVHCGDFLTQRPRTERVYQTIVGNPPYLRLLNVPQPLRAEYEITLPGYARADMLHAFLDRSASLLARDGELALVTADRWLTNENAARLREVVGQHFGLASIVRLDATSAFYRPKQRRAGTPPRVHPVAVVLRGRGSGARTIGREPIYDGEQIAHPVHSQLLGEVAEVRLAPWLGTQGIFVVDDEVAAAWPADATVPAIDTHDLRGGVLTQPRRRAILTSPEQEPHPEVLDHIDRELPRMCARGRSAVRWMPPEPFFRFDLSQPSLVIARIAKRLMPVRIAPGILPVNHNLSIIRAGKMSLDEIETLLNSSAANDWITSRARRLENGYFSITTRFLRSMPVFS